MAWAQQNGGVAKVQVQVDGGPWQDAELGPWPATTTGASGTSPGRPSPAPTTSPAASSTATGNTQTPARVEPFPEGSCGIQQLIVKVA